MGYYSEVALCLTQKAYTRLQAKMAEIEDRVIKYEVENFLPTAEFSEAEEDVLFYWSNVKWYEDYRAIAFQAYPKKSLQKWWNMQMRSDACLWEALGRKFPVFLQLYIQIHVK